MSIRASTSDQSVGAPLLTRRQVAERLALSQRLVDQLLLDGIIPSLHIGRTVRVCPADVEAFIASRRYGVGLSEVVNRIEAALADDDGRTAEEVPDG